MLNYICFALGVRSKKNFPVALAFVCISGLLCILGFAFLYFGFTLYFGLIFIRILGCGFFFFRVVWIFLQVLGGLLGWSAFEAGFGV
jgi:hypothetical protein